MGRKWLHSFRAFGETLAHWQATGTEEVGIKNISQGDFNIVAV
jgi:hypothetical protein